MTTIVYDHERRQIACDSRLTRDGLICTDKNQKWRHVKNQVWFFCGKISEEDALIDFYNGLKDKYEKNYYPEARAIVVDGNSVFVTLINHNCELELIQLSFSESIGSGNEFALAALDFGKSAKESVEYAMTRDSGTGGNVHVYDIESARFL